MVKKKAASKRMSYKNKYKIVKKNKEKKRKDRRDIRRNPSLRKKIKKDPGLPNLYPYKESFLTKLKEDAEEERRLQIENSVEGKKRKREMMEFERENEVVKKQRLDDAKSKDVVSKVRNPRKEFRDVVRASDVILEVLDARDPIGTRSKLLESQIRSVDPEKRIVLVLNKIDLVPRSNVESWLRYLRNELPAIGFKASVQKKDNKGKNTGDISECLGADGLISLLKNYCSSGNKKPITVGIIGFPNVGKKSIINSLKRTKAVGAQSGSTKISQTIVLDSNIRLLENAGIIFNPDHVPEEEAVEAILKKCKRENLMELYQIGSFKTASEFLNNVAQRRGKLMQGGVLDINAAEKIVLSDWNIGKIPYYTILPADKHLNSEIVSEEFNIDSIKDMEQEMLDTLHDNDYGFNSFTSKEVNVEMKLDSDSEDDQPELNIKANHEKIEPKKKRKGQTETLNKQMKEIIKKKQSDGEDEHYDFGMDFWSNHEGEIINAEENVDEFTY